MRLRRPDRRSQCPCRKWSTTTPIQRPDELREKLQRRAVEQILSGTTWLSTSQVGKLANPNAKNQHALASRLLKDKRIFAIQRR
jgi:hypothetical protein